ncbi:MAG: hypothetical protein IPH12_10080 [Saprospirales bacterium]|nr:hypothetical protein [Saprospirales bacterium]MBK8922862.1 hypothetical protein [Saprospirales bacterium]
MRIMGYIEHPHLKITVFQTDGRVSVQFENQGYALTFKLGEDERLNSLDAIRNWADTAFLDDVLRNMERMHQSRLAANTRAVPAAADEEFEVIT